MRAGFDINENNNYIGNAHDRSHLESGGFMRYNLKKSKIIDITRGPIL